MSSTSISSSPESPASSDIPSDSDVGGREASELDPRLLQSDLVVTISTLLSLSNNEAASWSGAYHPYHITKAYPMKALCCIASTFSLATFHCIL